MDPVNTMPGVHLSTEFSRHQKVKGDFQTRPFCHQLRVPNHCGQATGVDESQSRVGQSWGCSSWDRWGSVSVSTGRRQESDWGGRRPTSLMKNSQKASAHSQDSQGEAQSQDKCSG